MAEIAVGADRSTGFAGTYQNQAAAYDRTRSAGSETVGPLLAALAAAPGKSILDIGGGTGNYAVAMIRRGFDVLVVDRSAEMLAVAVSKGLRVVRADATALPQRTDTADAVTMIAVLHQVPDWRKALSEAVRVLRPGGVLYLLLYTQEHMESHYFLDYFPSTRAWAGRDMRPIAEYVAALPGASASPMQIRGTDDLTMQIMRRHPQLALDPTLTAQTSYFARLSKENPDELALGMQRLARDISAGRLPVGYDRDLPDGDAYRVIWAKPA